MRTCQFVIKKHFFSSAVMSHSKFEYVRTFETNDQLLPNSWIVVRIDGKNFHTFSDKHEFTKPNDETALNLMNECARRVMSQFSHVVLAYGQSDEYSFVFKKDTDLYTRRSSKVPNLFHYNSPVYTLMTNIVSLFASTYTFSWASFFPSMALKYPPSFDARCVLYPTNKNLRDYLSWRQADCHINNLYNTVFWALIQKGNLSPSEAQERLSGTLSSHKNEILFSEFGINYNNEKQQFRKGTVLYRKQISIPVEETTQDDQIETKVKKRRRIVEENRDIIGDEFWKENLHILGPYENS